VRDRRSQRSQPGIPLAIGGGAGGRGRQQHEPGIVRGGERVEGRDVGAVEQALDRNGDGRPPAARRDLVPHLVRRQPQVGQVVDRRSLQALDGPADAPAAGLLPGQALADDGDCPAFGFAEHERAAGGEALRRRRQHVQDHGHRPPLAVVERRRRLDPGRLGRGHEAVDRRIDAVEHAKERRGLIRIEHVRRPRRQLPLELDDAGRRRPAGADGPGDGGRSGRAVGRIDRGRRHGNGV
jgi:hypothetical protein